MHLTTDLILAGNNNLLALDNIRVFGNNLLTPIVSLINLKYVKLT